MRKWCRDCRPEIKVGSFAEEAIRKELDYLESMDKESTK
jgi:hypothetical protein